MKFWSAGVKTGIFGLPKRRYTGPSYSAIAIVAAFAWLILDMNKSKKKQDKIIELEQQILQLEESIMEQEKSIVTEIKELKEIVSKKQ